ncbi:MAG: phosphoribosyltransferase family protein [Luminiphilus sp.]|nr:phosphoribosyltransferase family protein [Luminiphilus sp.]
MQRGFDHTWVLAHALKSQHYPSLMVRPWLRNRGPRKAQHLLDRATRWQDATDRFTADSKLAGHRVILVDDVMTTGATARAAARVCGEAGAQSVEVWCLARTPAPITAR